MHIYLTYICSPIHACVFVHIHTCYKDKKDVKNLDENVCNYFQTNTSPQFKLIKYTKIKKSSIIMLQSDFLGKINRLKVYLIR